MSPTIPFVAAFTEFAYDDRDPLFIEIALHPSINPSDVTVYFYGRNSATAANVVQKKVYNMGTWTATTLCSEKAILYTQTFSDPTEFHGNSAVRAQMAFGITHDGNKIEFMTLSSGLNVLDGVFMGDTPQSRYSGTVSTITARVISIGDVRNATTYTWEMNSDSSTSTYQTLPTNVQSKFCPS